MVSKSHFSIVHNAATVVPVDAGEQVRIVNPQGTQVVDTWAFSQGDFDEYLSMEHTRSALENIYLSEGDIAVSNRFRPVLTLIEDGSSGFHDTLMAACSRETYEHFGAGSNHKNCSDNLKVAIQKLGRDLTFIPCPWNLFQRTPIDMDGTLEFPAPSHPPNSFVLIRAEMPVYFVFSACPWDLADSPINGTGPKDDCYVVLESDE
ncbi:MAG: urea carboxylase-associated family protein [Bdellovibrionales bacterium]|nr:urea carboxylase-associated family protein [Bdellovibrionales bacterium]